MNNSIKTDIKDYDNKKYGTWESNGLIIYAETKSTLPIEIKIENFCNYCGDTDYYMNEDEAKSFYKFLKDIFENQEPPE